MRGTARRQLASGTDAPPIAPDAQMSHCPVREPQPGPSATQDPGNDPHNARRSSDEARQFRASTKPGAGHATGGVLPPQRAGKDTAAGARTNRARRAVACLRR
jgi:hypothetical protein